MRRLHNRVLIPILVVVFIVLVTIVQGHLLGRAFLDEVIVVANLLQDDCFEVRVNQSPVPGILDLGKVRQNSSHGSILEHGRAVHVGEGEEPCTVLLADPGHEQLLGPRLEPCNLVLLTKGEEALQDIVWSLPGDYVGIEVVDKGLR